MKKHWPIALTLVIAAGALLAILYLDKWDRVEAVRDTQVQLQWCKEHNGKPIMRQNRFGDWSMQFCQLW